MRNVTFGICAVLFSSSSMAQVTLTGYVRTYAGLPLAGATVKLVTLNRRVTTDAQGHYDFSAAAIQSGTQTSNFTLKEQSGQLSLNLDKGDKVSVEIFNLAGKSLNTLVDQYLPAGNNVLELGALGNLNQMCVAKIQTGSETSWYKMSLHGSFVAISEAYSHTNNAALFKTSAAAVADSLSVTLTGYFGGLMGTNGRKISSTTGVKNFRLFSTDASWNVCAPKVTFNYDNSAGATYYKQVIADPQATEQEVQREVCQSIWQQASEVGNKYTTYIADITSQSGVANTGGNTLNFSTDYINGKPWYEIVGVQMHEANHSYQPYYTTTGADGFGEAMPDAVRALTGFFMWPPGTKCSGGYTQVYQGGGQYWYYIEMKHPGFIHGIYKLTAGDISVRVQTVTGEALSSMATQCETTGMPAGGA
jgi:Peptidase of plants and bacteria